MFLPTIVLRFRIQRGECITGVSLGQACVMYYVHESGQPPQEWKPVEGLEVNTRRLPVGKLCVEVTLPRRSIYIMYGPARMEWKHGIRVQTADRLASFPAPPSWNPWNLRRTLTLRCTKAYYDAYLQRLLEEKPNDAKLQERWNQQSQFRPQNGDKRLNNDDLAKERERGQETLRRMLQSPLSQHALW